VGRHESSVMRLSVVIVTWNEEQTIARCLPALLRELRDGDEVIVSDNASEDGTLAAVERLAPDAKVVQNGGNVGFPAACNSGAEAATGELLVLLNPDTIVAPGWGDAIRRPAEDGRGWGAWQALVTMDGGTRVNTDGGVVHFTGIAWAGHMGEPISAADATPHEIGFASGACMALRLAKWREVGGMPAHFFLYYDDPDMAFRLRLAGARIGLEPTALVDHEYEFSRRSVKWRMLERNRVASLIRAYPTALLILLAPALLATELGILAAAAASGWAGQKLLSWRDIGAVLPQLLRERRAIQAGRTASAQEFARWLTPALTSNYLGPVARTAPLQWAMRAYWAVVVAVLKLGRL
jgi:GT2 family glycosyltransferase